MEKLFGKKDNDEEVKTREFGKKEKEKEGFFKKLFRKKSASR